MSTVLDERDRIKSNTLMTWMGFIFFSDSLFSIVAGHSHTDSQGCYALGDLTPDALGQEQETKSRRMVLSYVNVAR